MRKIIFILFTISVLTSCQDEESSPTGIAYSMAGTYSVVYSPTQAPTKYVTLTVQPISSSRALLVYNPYVGSQGQQNLWLWPNDTVDLLANNVASIGPDTFTVNGSQVIHSATGSYTQNTIVFPQHRHTMMSNIYTSRIEATK